ncbi:MAG: EF-P beta-lysylation protein EpmB [Gammaproteobacteria bacterium]|nr:EF-P beta-lysylation protein EpmB [Gammaproteobacteria bacterium]
MSVRKKHSWQEALSDLITDPKELLTLLELDPALLEQASLAARLFPLKVPRGFVARMEKGNVDDPLLKQVLPLGLELEVSSAYTADPLAEKNANPLPGLLHKYHGRVLITLTSACAIHCRYCFRRAFPYENNNPSSKGLDKILAYINADTAISEVILSGGDPLAVSDKFLQRFTDQLGLIKHVKRLRIHTRLPIVLPERVTTDFLQWIDNLSLDKVCVVHANHPQEINEEVQTALLQLRKAGVTMLNQTVLLKGINDQVDVLAALSETLFSAGVLPYYLHVLDKVQGAGHFDLPRTEAMRLHHELTSRLPGYLVPRLACEEPGAAAKTLLSTALYTG